MPFVRAYFFGGGGYCRCCSSGTIRAPAAILVAVHVALVANKDGPARGQITSILGRQFVGHARVVEVLGIEEPVVTVLGDLLLAFSAIPIRLQGRQSRPGEFIEQRAEGRPNSGTARPPVPRPRRWSGTSIAGPSERRQRRGTPTQGRRPVP